MNPNDNLENQTAEKKKNTDLQSNIINIEVPEIKEEGVVPTVENPTPIEPTPNSIVTNQSKDNVMHEKQIDDGTVNGKGVLPVFIIFGLFIVLIIGLPYINDVLSKIKSDKDIKEATEQQKKDDNKKNESKIDEKTKETDKDNTDNKQDSDSKVEQTPAPTTTPTTTPESTSEPTSTPDSTQQPAVDPATVPDSPLDLEGNIDDGSSLE